MKYHEKTGFCFLWEKGKEMKTKITITMCFLLMALPVLSFATEKDASDFGVLADEFAKENAKIKRDQDELNRKADKEMIVKKLAEKKAAKVKKKADEAQAKAARIARKKQSSPSASVDENAMFKHSEEVFNNKENKTHRAKKRAEKEAVKVVEEQKKEDEAQDKGEGQVKVKF